MRTYQITVNGKQYTVQVSDPNASPVSVQVNGKLFQVTLAEQGAATRPVESIQPDTELAEPFVPSTTSTFVDVSAPPEPQPVQPSAAPGAVAAVLHRVIAPMPGKILDIVAKAGDQVKQGDTLCNLEAMKMKSPIRSTGGGVIAQVLINEGQNVNYGDTLFTLR